MDYRALPELFELRTQLKPGDVGSIVQLHCAVYSQEHGFDHTFEDYVAVPLAAFVRQGSSRERLWIVERDGRIAGCVAIVAHSSTVAQLRWFLVDPASRGLGLGGRLLDEAVNFCKEAGYDTVILWPVDSLVVAAHLYRSAGFQKVEERRGRQWGVDLVEERYELHLKRGGCGN